MIIQNLLVLDYNHKLFIQKKYLVKDNMVVFYNSKNLIKKEQGQMGISILVLYKKKIKINHHMDKDLEEIYLDLMEKV